MPGAPYEPSLPNGQAGPLFMKPSEKRTPSAPRHSSWKPPDGATAGATSAASVSGRSPSSPPPFAKAP